MRLFISNGIWIPRDFPAIGEVMRELSFVNPQYEKVQKMGYWAGNVPTEYCCWRAEGDYIVVPLGYKKQIHIKCQKLGIPLEFEDHRCSKEGVSLEFNGTLRDYQEEAVERMKIFSNGVLVAPAGSGKTVVALRLIADLKLRTLVLVHTKDIMIQWRDRINEFLDYEPGFIGAGSQDYNEGITIATFQTLNKRINDFDYGLVIADECLAGDTLIVMKDGTLKPIKEIKEGDLVVGGFVKNKIHRQAHTKMVRTQLGGLKCTLNHPHFTVPQNRIKRDKEKAVDSPVSIEDIKIKTTKELEVGDYLLSPEFINFDFIETPIFTWTPAQLSFVAMIMADGHLENYRVKVSIRKDQDYYRKIFKEGLEGFGCLETYRESYNCREDLTIWSNDKRLIDLLNNVFKVPFGKKALTIYIPDSIMRSPLNSILAFIETMYSTDGYVSVDKRSTAIRIHLDLTSEKFISQFQYLLKRLGVHSTIQEIKRKGEKQNTVYRLGVGGRDIAVLIKRIGALRNQRKNALIRFKTGEGFEGYEVEYGGQNYKLVKIKEIESIGTKDVYDFETDTHTFIANNHITHNCHHVAADTFSYVVQQFYPSKLYGLTATPERADHLEEFYYSIIGPIIHKIKDDALIERGVKIIPEVYKIYTDFHGQLRGNNWQNFYSRVAEDESRNEIIIQNAIREPDNYHLILSKRVQHCIDLHEKLNQHGMRAGLCIGSMGKEERQSNLNAMRNGQLHFLVATSQLADEALDIPILDRLHIGIPTAFSGRVIQQIGRIQRPHPHKQNAIIYDYYDEQSDVLCTLYNKRYWQIYRKNGFPIREIRDFQNNY
jgi:superfamily II DNA or RNA helicase/intein/homing endonuclease